MTEQAAERQQKEQGKEQHVTARNRKDRGGDQESIKGKPHSQSSS